MKFGDTRLWLTVATLVAVVATAGSLYFSEVMGLFPCRLCWFQRILMYPLVVVLGVAAIENHATVYRTVLPLSVLGALVAAYHSYIQVAGESAICSVGGCGTVQYTLFGLLSIPNLSLIGFVLVSAAMVVVARGRLTR